MHFVFIISQVGHFPTLIYTALDTYSVPLFVERETLNRGAIGRANTEAHHWLDQMEGREEC